MKTVKGLSAALATRYEGPTKEIRGMTYIPWNYSVNQANEVFDIDGYDITVQSVKREGDGYQAIVRVTAYASDGTRPIVRDGVGYSDVLTNRDGKELIDTAVKAAASDALSRALKLFGDAFGLYLYDKDEQPTSSNGSRQGSAPAKSNGGAKRGGPTEKQVEWLIKKGIVADEEEAAEMTFDEAKAALDKAFNGGGNGKAAPTKAAAPAKSSRRSTPDDEEDLPF